MNSVHSWFKKREHENKEKRKLFELHALVVKKNKPREHKNSVQNRISMISMHSWL